MQIDNKEIIFNIGDKIKSVVGNIGVVKSISTNGLFLHIKFKDWDSLVLLNIDGKQTAWHKKPFIRKVGK